MSLAGAALLYAELSWIRLKRQRLLWSCLVLLVLPLGGAVILVAGGHWGRELFDRLLEVHLRFLVLFLPALLAAPVVAEEIEGKTFTFLFARPAPRAAVVLGKYLAVALPLTLAMAAVLALEWLLAHARFPSDFAPELAHLLRAEAACALGVLGFTSLSALLGTLFTRQPFVAVLGYMLVVEAGLSSAPLVLCLITFSWHLRNIAGLPRAQPAFTNFSVSVGLSVALVMAAALAALWGAARALRNAEYH